MLCILLIKHCTQIPSSSKSTSPRKKQYLKDPLKRRKTKSCPSRRPELSIGLFLRVKSSQEFVCSRKEVQITTNTVVRGDIVVLGTGDVVPADSRKKKPELLEVVGRVWWSWIYPPENQHDNGKPTIWNLKMYFLFNMGIFQFHVSLQGCIPEFWKVFLQIVCFNCS